MSFVQQFDAHHAWRQRGLAQLDALADWLAQHQLLSPSAQERLQQLRAQLKSDKVMVAFVAEFSRGKSELINAVFFATYGRRIMPASAGRTLTRVFGIKPSRNAKVSVPSSVAPVGVAPRAGRGAV